MESPRGKQIVKRLNLETTKVYPDKDLMFRCFTECPEFPPRVVILGQDPYYHTIEGLPVADGIAFSSGVKGYIPPALRIIFEELSLEYACFPSYLESGNSDLKRWANQGVLLLNSSITVCHNCPGSHESLWKGFIRQILDSFDHSDTAFLLLGRKANEMKPWIKSELCISLPHPAVHLKNPLRPGDARFDQSKAFLGSNCFKEINLWLQHKQLKPIDWLGI